MTRDQQSAHFDQITLEAKNLMFSKSDDYAAGDDCLINFKIAGASMGHDAETNCLGLISTKVARLGQLKKKKKPNQDVVDYFVLNID